MKAESTRGAEGSFVFFGDGCCGPSLYSGSYGQRVIAWSAVATTGARNFPGKCAEGAPRVLLDLAVGCAHELHPLAIGADRLGAEEAGAILSHFVDVLILHCLGWVFPPWAGAVQGEECACGA